MHEELANDWPPRWELTAPRLAVTELVARRIVSTVEVESSGRRRKGASWALVDGPNAKQPVEPPLDVVLDLIRATERRAELPHQVALGDQAHPYSLDGLGLDFGGAFDFGGGGGGDGGGGGGGN